MRQVKLHGVQWVLVVYKDVPNKETGEIARKRVHEHLASRTLYPFKDDVNGRKQVREKLADKIENILRPLNAGLPDAAMMDGLLTVEKYINDVYWKRCEQRTKLEGANHMEPSTIHGYRKIFNKHIVGKPVASIQMTRFTAKDGQDWLDSLPQRLSHKNAPRSGRSCPGFYYRTTV